MMSIIKFLGLLLVIFLAYDTANFMFEAHKTAVSAKQQLEVRPVYEAVEIRPQIIEAEEEEEEDDWFLELGFLAFMICIAALLLAYFVRRKRYLTKDRQVKAIETKQFSEEHLSYVEDEVDFLETISTQPRQSLCQLDSEVKPSSPNSKYVHLYAAYEDSSGPSTAPYDRLRNALEVAIDSGNEGRSDDDMLCSDNALHNTPDVTTESTLTQTHTTTCNCHFEQFEERMASVEHQVKTNAEITHEWSKRIERAEVEVVNLHRQMYTVLSKAEFVPPCSDFFAKHGGDSTPTSFLEPTLQKLSDDVETGKQMESGDLFVSPAKSFPQNDNWSSVDEELEDRIKELTTSASRELRETVTPLAPDHNNIKDALMKKKEELKEKTRGIVKAMEEAVKASAARKSKLGVHSHFVAPYKRIQHADSDNCAR